MPSTFISDVAKGMTPEEASVLKATPTKGQSVEHADTSGKVLYQLKRKGLVRTTRPDGKGRYFAYRTKAGEEVVAALPKRRVRVQRVAS